MIMILRILLTCTSLELINWNRDKGKRKNRGLILAKKNPDKAGEFSFFHIIYNNYFFFTLAIASFNSVLIAIAFSLAAIAFVCAAK
jgi:hypothetical protein